MAGSFRARERRKAKYADFLRNERERVKAYRQKQKASETASEIKQLRKCEADRKRKYRKRKQERNDHQELLTPESKKVYVRLQSFDKAVTRALRALPRSPEKQHAVVAGIARPIGFKLEEKMTATLGKHGLNLSESRKAAVMDLYFRPDVVYTMPGMKDEMFAWDSDGNKQRKRKYFLTMFLREAFTIYRSEVDEPVSFAKFCELRPENVILLKNSPNDQCKCLTHENLRLRLTGLKVTYESQKFWTEVMCDATPNSVCWRQKRDVCVNGQLLQLPVSIEPDSQVKWKEWENIEKMCSDGSVRKVLVSSSKQGKAKELLGALKDNHEQTAVHINVKRIQAHNFEDDKKTPFVRILQVDFAMNYSCEYQNEV